MNTHQQPSSKEDELLEMFREKYPLPNVGYDGSEQQYQERKLQYAFVKELIYRAVVHGKSSCQSLLTSHSEAIRERVEQEREELYKQILNVVDDEEKLGVAPFMKRTLDRIRALLTDDKTNN